MTFLEATVLITRWAHVIATVAWIGGNIFYLAAPPSPPSANSMAAT